MPKQTNHYHMNFKFSRQPRGQTTTSFHVLADDNSTCGIITVPNAQADDLAKHWLGSAPAPARATAGNNPMVSAMMTAAKKHPLSRGAVLRGC
jgi:hypothetical protein